MVEFEVVLAIAVALGAMEEVLTLATRLDELMTEDDWNELVKELVVTVVALLETTGEVPTLEDVEVEVEMTTLLVELAEVGEGLAGRVKVDDCPRTSVRARR